MHNTDLASAARRFMDQFVADGDPASLIVPEQIVMDGPDAVNNFTTAFDDLSRALSAYQLGTERTTRCL